MTFPKPSASWSVSLISRFQNSEWNKEGWQRLCRSQTEMEMSVVPQQREFAGSSHHHWCNRVCQHSQEGKGEASVYFWIQRLILAVGALLLNAGPEGDAQIGRGTGLEGVSSALFWKATSAERQPSDLMDGFSFQIVNAFTRSHQLTGNRLLKIFHSILSHHIPSNSRLFGQNRFVKKLRLFLSQVPCFSWNDWMPKRWNF